MRPLLDRHNVNGSTDLRHETGPLAHHLPIATNQADAEPSLAANDPGLRAVIEAWSQLPAAVRAGIVAMVKAASEE